MNSRWRKRASEVIYGVVREVGTDDLDELEKQIRAAYPFGERAMWPYKVWLSQVNRVMKVLRRYEVDGIPDDPDLTGLPLFNDKEKEDDQDDNH